MAYDLNSKLANGLKEIFFNTANFSLFRMVSID